MRALRSHVRRLGEPDLALDEVPHRHTHWSNCRRGLLRRRHGLTCWHERGEVGERAPGQIDREAPDDDLLAAHRGDAAHLEVRAVVGAEREGQEGFRIGDCGFR